MLAELGHFALVLALVIALAGSFFALAGAQRSLPAWMALARPAAAAQFLFVAIAFFALMLAFARGDFSVLLVVAHSNVELPLAYRLAATWGSHEGSMLLWVFMLGGWTSAVAGLSRALPQASVARVIGVMCLVSSGLLAFVLFTSNPFARLSPPALDGRDLNPLLQDPGMVLHPPLLYMGYVGFAVVYAFAVAALLAGRFDASWARWSRPWTAAAWLFLTLGIALGSWWAYTELGWGGWWFWDPVENASLMPWLAGTALLHSLAVAEKRGAFKAWTLLLAIATFGLSLLGTFLVRSGVLSSVHAFATDPARGVFILVLLSLVVGGALLLYGMRAAQVGFGGRFDALSRETALLANNLLLVCTTAAVMLGTLYPLALDALGLGKISVGAPYFEAVFVPLMAPLVLLLGVGPLLRWKSASAPELATSLRVPLAVTAAAAALLPLAAGRVGWLVSLGLGLAAWVLATSGLLLLRQCRGGWRMLARMPAGSWGMLVAHLGVGVFIVGVTMVRGYEVERDVRLAIGEAVDVAGHRFTLRDLRLVDGPNYQAVRAAVEVSRSGEPRRLLEPEKRVYRVQQMPMTEAAIDSGLTRDLYVALGERIDERSWTLRVHFKPFVGWIWGGALLMALGAALALADRRYRLAGRHSEAAAAVSPRVAA